MLVANLPGATPVDLQNANGSPAASPRLLSNSWPRWSPFVQTYKGGRLLWIAFSSTRDYGLLVRNSIPGMHPCYPPGSYEQPAGALHTQLDALCQQPKLWMAAIDLSSTSGIDPSYPAFYVPFQDIATHDHMPQWTPALASAPPLVCIPTGGSCVTNPTGCCTSLPCLGNGLCEPGGPP